MCMAMYNAKIEININSNGLDLYFVQCRCAGATVALMTFQFCSLPHKELCKAYEYLVIIKINTERG